MLHDPDSLAATLMQLTEAARLNVISASGGTSASTSQPIQTRFALIPKWALSVAHQVLAELDVDYVVTGIIRGDQ
jgi:hypothetical protein